MISASAFLDCLKERGFSQYAGVPCSYLKPFINQVIDDPSLDYVGAASEGEAVAVSLGAHLAGRKTVTMCQNSGLGNMVNPLTSLNFPFRIPTLLIVTWRGKPGQTDEPQHEQMGEITPALLDLMEIPWKIFPQSESEIESAIAIADDYMQTHNRPYAFIMEKGSVSPHELERKASDVRIATEKKIFSGGQSDRLTRTEAIDLLLQLQNCDTAIVATTGKTGRELFAVNDAPSNIYVVGGMGTASAIGFGIAHALPDRKITVLDGDGAALMKMGAMATIGFYQPKNLLHVILDNEQHDSTGGQQTVSSTVRFAEVAAAVNYRNAAFAETKNEISDAFTWITDREGPSLLHVKIKAGSPAGLGRPTVKPHDVKDRFMNFLNPAPARLST